MNCIVDKIFATYVPTKIKLFSVFAVTLFFAVLLGFAKLCFPQSIGENIIGVQEIEVSLNRSRDDTVIVVGSQVRFNFPAGSERIAILREWPGIGHIAEKDVLITDGGIVLPVSPRFNQIYRFAIWLDDYPFPVQSREYFLVVLPAPPLLDVNEDGIVDKRDRERLKSLLGTRSAERRYDPRCDLNGDGWINRLDWLVFEQGKYW